MIRIIILLTTLLSGLAIANQNNGEMEIQKIADNVFLHTSYAELPQIGYYPSNGLVVLDGTNAYIIDTPWLEKDTQVLLEWIERSGFALKASISTHFHADRTSGIGYLNNHSIETYASELTNQHLESVGGEKATSAFEGPEFSLLKDKIEVYYPGAGHTQDNIVVWLPESQILFGGCLIRNLETNSMGNTADGSLSDWANTVQNVVDKFPAVKRVVPGHEAIGGAELLAHTIELAEKNFNKSAQTNINPPSD